MHNLLSKELSEEQMHVLMHEAPFNTANARPANRIAAVESFLSQTEATDEAYNHISHQVSFLLMVYRPRDVLSEVERDALEEFRAENDIVIVPAFYGRIGQDRIYPKSQKLVGRPSVLGPIRIQSQ
ncbi:unnamed protein product [Schistocephalus solidus]|uniref:DUF1330 domain-containing protein n=1 Tax=Schistocephalus solidus TaxID=70667 RepID=A0A183SBX9_SCHSO|nr:unnamed protein product [Schistocephalus solidus]